MDSFFWRCLLLLCCSIEVYSTVHGCVGWGSACSSYCRLAGHGKADPRVAVVKHCVVRPEEDVPKDPEGAGWHVQAHEAADALACALERGGEGGQTSMVVVGGGGGRSDP